MTDDQTNDPQPEPAQPDPAPRRRGKLDPNRAPEFDPTDHTAVAAYIEKYGHDAFVTERNRQTGFTVTETTTAPQN